MEDIKTRLEQTSQACIAAFDAWSKDKKKSEAQEALSEAIHELRKVSSRLEIELAISERNDSQKPIPIPTHRASRGKKGGDDEGRGNAPQPSDSAEEAAGPQVESKPRRRRTANKGE